MGSETDIFAQANSEEMEAIWNAIESAVKQEEKEKKEQGIEEEEPYVVEDVDADLKYSSGDLDAGDFMKLLEDDLDQLQDVETDVIDVSSQTISPSTTDGPEKKMAEQDGPFLRGNEKFSTDVNLRKFDESMEEENFAKDFDFESMKALVSGKQSPLHVEESDADESEEPDGTTEFIDTRDTRDSSLDQTVVLRADGGPQIISENEYEIEIQNAFFRRKVQKWKNKTMADEMSMKYWGRKAPDFVPADPMSLYDGDMSADEAIGNLTEARDLAMAAMEQYANDSFLFTNFIQGMYNLPPLIEIEIKDMAKYENLTQEMKKALDNMDFDRALAIEEQMNGMKYREVPDWDQDKEDIKWFDEGVQRKKGLKWDTDEDFVEIVDRELEDLLEKMDKLGEYFNPETYQIEQARIPFSSTPGARFDPKLVGKGIVLSNNGRTATRMEAGRPSFALFSPGQGGAKEPVTRWRIRCDRSISNIFVGVLKIPFAPTEGVASLLATPAWFINSVGLAYRMGPSQKEDEYEVIDKENMTIRNESTRVWEEGFRFNPSYRKEGCEMIVDPLTGDISWFEADEVTKLAEAGAGDEGIAEWAEMQATWLLTTYGREKVEVDLFRFLQIEKRRMKNETWIDTFNRSVDDGEMPCWSLSWSHLSLLHHHHLLLLLFSLFLPLVSLLLLLLFLIFSLQDFGMSWSKRFLSQIMRHLGTRTTQPKR